MPEKKIRSDEIKRALGQEPLKNQNPNRHHNSRKEALGPNGTR